MISYLSSVFKETRDSPLEETYFDKSRGSERSVELIECFQLLISMLNKLSEDEMADLLVEEAQRPTQGS